jgi:hypothetical protein
MGTMRFSLGSEDCISKPIKMIISSLNHDRSPQRAIKCLEKAKKTNAMEGKELP